MNGIEWNILCHLRIYLFNRVQFEAVTGHCKYNPENRLVSGGFLYLNVFRLSAKKRKIADVRCLRNLQNVLYILIRMADLYKDIIKKLDEEHKNMRLSLRSLGVIIK